MFRFVIIVSLYIYLSTIIIDTEIWANSNLLQIKIFLIKLEASSQRDFFESN